MHLRVLQAQWSMEINVGEYGVALTVALDAIGAGTEIGRATP